MQKPANATGEISILNKEGDTKHFWSKNSEAEVQVARQVFETYVQRGYRAASMKNDAEGEILKDFDPNAEQILFIPQMQGG